MVTLAAFACGFILDMLIGDPQWLWHPVQGIGWLISKTERVMRSILPASKQSELYGGAILIVLVLAGSTAIPFGILYAAGMVHPYVKFVVETVMCAQILAMKSLKTESMKVKYALDQGNTEQARTYVSYIVGRDTKVLTEEGMIKATVETVAENSSDGVIAPMLYLIMGGPVLGFAYKAVNTMDSMIGYKNDRYLYFGRAAAKLDDLCNFIPARLTAWIMIAAAGITGMDAGRAVSVYKRDRKKHASPNAAHTEAVMAGALGVALAGDAWYFGKLHKKETIGDACRMVEAEDIGRANRLLYATGILTFSICILGKLGYLLVR